MIENSDENQPSKYRAISRRKKRRESIDRPNSNVLKKKRSVSYLKRKAKESKKENLNMGAR
jgi:hypothetical protein